LFEHILCFLVGASVGNPLPTPANLFAGPRLPDCGGMIEKAIRWIAVMGAALGCGFGQSTGTFAPTGSMTIQRAGHTAVLLADGRVLIAGGSGDATAEIFDPSTSAFTATSGMSISRHMASSTLLPDGRVLIAGGDTTGTPTPTASAELYDPASGTFVPTGSLTSPRTGHTAMLLANGKVLVIGGFGAFGTAVRTAELYDPTTGLFTEAGSFGGNIGCDFCPPSVLLADGSALSSTTTPALLYDPDTAAFAQTGSAIDYHNAATLLISGKVLLAGGEDDFGRKNSAELYDPSAGGFLATSDMVWRRSWHSLTLLPDGTALAAGGETDGCNAGSCTFSGTLATAEIYDPDKGTFSGTGSMTAPRETHTATLLNDGRVLLAGGVAYGGVNAFFGPTPSAELYTPMVLVARPKLFSGAFWHSATGQGVSSVAPAVAGEAVSFYTTGLAPGGAIPPQVFIGGRAAAVLYFGDAPGYSGFNQVNIRVPEGIPAGSQVAVRLSYLQRSSNQVMIAAQ
jgi:hypothetical protein